MVSILTANNLLARDNHAPAPSVKADGSNYPWRMFFNDNSEIVDADTTVECLEYLIPGYTVMTDSQRLLARNDLARGVQQQARAVIAGNVDPDKVEDWEWAVLTYGDENGLDAYGWGDGTGELGQDTDEESIDFWSSEYPLVLVNTAYEPYGKLRRPMSSEGDYEFVKNLIWLEPSSEEAFLHSLSRIGYIHFGKPRVVEANNK